jgi:SAM-dependent methyltransferase
MTARSGPDEVLQAYYALGREQERLAQPLGQIEFERTKEIIGPQLPAPPARIADIGSGPGRYAIWLASLGHRVTVRDLVRLHVEQVAASARAAGVEIDVALGDARRLDLPDQAFDAVLLLGPMYHLQDVAERATCLAEARRVLRPGGVLFVAAISRWAPRLHAEVAARLYREIEGLRDETPLVESTGVMPPLYEGGFSAYCHRPQELRAEVEAADLECLDVVSVEGIAFALPDLGARMADELDRQVILDAARVTGSVPELSGLGPHLLATARRGSASSGYSTAMTR